MRSRQRAPPAQSLSLSHNTNVERLLGQLLSHFALPPVPPVRKQHTLPLGQLLLLEHESAAPNPLQLPRAAHLAPPIVTQQSCVLASHEVMPHVMFAGGALSTTRMPVSVTEVSAGSMPPSRHSSR